MQLRTWLPQISDCQAHTCPPLSFTFQSFYVTAFDVMSYDDDDMPMLLQMLLNLTTSCLELSHFFIDSCSVIFVYDEPKVKDSLFMIFATADLIFNEITII